jgi:hypothetical protein
MNKWTTAKNVGGMLCIKLPLTLFSTERKLPSLKKALFSAFN